MGEMDEAYARLSRSKIFGPPFLVDGVLQPQGNPVRASVRQVAHEMESSLAQVFPTTALSA